MKRWILLLCLLPVIVLGQFVSEKTGVMALTITDSIAVADTAAASIRADSLWSDTVPLIGYGKVEIQVMLVQDTNWTNDTARIYAEFGTKINSGYMWTSVGPIWKLTASDTSTSITYQLDTLGYLPDYIRIRCVPRDSAEATQPARLANTYDNTFTILMKRWHLR